MIALKIVDVATMKPKSIKVMMHALVVAGLCLTFNLPGNEKVYAQASNKSAAGGAPKKAGAVPKHRIDLQEVRKVIDRLKKSGENWSEAEVQYVLQNINRDQLLLAIERWQSRRKILLPDDVEINILIDYLMTELSAVSVLSAYLDDVGTGKSATSFASKLKTQVAATTFKQYSFGRLELPSDVSGSELFIDNAQMRRDKDQRILVLTVGPHFVEIRRPSAQPCSETVTIDQYKLYSMICK